MRLFTEQTTAQRSTWTDVDRSVLATPHSSPSVHGSTPTSSNLMASFVAPDTDVRHALCDTHGYSLTDDGVPCPPPSAGTAASPPRGKYHFNVFGRSSSSTLPLKLLMAAALPPSADALVTEGASHAMAGFAIGSIVMGILMVLALSKAHSSGPLADRLDSRPMLSLTNTGILAIITLF